MKTLFHHLEKDRRQDDLIDASPPASRPQEDDEAQGVQEQEDGEEVRRSSHPRRELEGAVCF